jgi:AcrR family transcriptional regulator
MARPPKIRVEDIVDAALGLGHDKMSMRAVARSLGVSPSTLYYHVESAEELRGLVAERALEGFDVRLQAGTCWKPQLRQLALDLRRVFEQMPGMARQAMGDSEWDDTILQLHEDLCRELVRRGLSPSDAWLTVRAIAEYVEGFVTRLERIGSRWRMSRHSARLYPTLRAAQRDLGREEAERRFEFGLDALINGIAHHPGS